MENNIVETNVDSRRQFLKKAAYAAPAVIALGSLSAHATSTGSSIGGGNTGGGNTGGGNTGGGNTDPVITYARGPLLGARWTITQTSTSWTASGPLNRFTNVTYPVLGFNNGYYSVQSPGPFGLVIRLRAI